MEYFLNSLLAARITLISKPDKNITTKENYGQIFLITVDMKLPNKILAVGPGEAQCNLLSLT